MLTKEMVEDAPIDPGVYLFHGASGKILYIGKAKCLRKRVRSYLHNVKNRRSKIKRLIRWTESVQYQICQSEQEALFLEARLIKKYLPSYNSALKWGTQTWFIRITMDEDYPRLERVPEIQEDSAEYFGPLSSRRWTDEAIDVLQRIFMVRTCQDKIKPTVGYRACLQYDMKRCYAPCAALITQEFYRDMIVNLINLLEGEYEKVQTDLIEKRNSAAAQLHFEKAAAIQQQLVRLQKVFPFLDAHRHQPETDRKKIREEIAEAKIQVSNQIEMPF